MIIKKTCSFLVFAVIAFTVYGQVCHIPQDNHRFDCHPAYNATIEACVARNCCWNEALAETNPAVPMCYFPLGFSPYFVSLTEKTTYGYRYQIEKKQKSFLPNEIMKLDVHVIFISGPIVRIRIVDSNKERFEVPYVYTDPIPKESVEKQFDVQVKSDPFSLKIVHKMTGNVVIDTSVAPLLYSDQFIQFSSSLLSYFVYGLGEHRNPLRLTTSWQTLSFWSRDQPPVINHNLYGINPFAMMLDNAGNAHGMFLLNSNAMDVVLQPAPAITFRTIGGIIDLFVYAGPTAEDVIRQHWSIIKPPYFQPMWAMGFHLCRYGYKDIDDLKSVIQRMNKTKFPYDTQWTDIDAMHNKLVFTYDKTKWAGLPDLVQKLHENDMHYIPINDPCIGSKEANGTYPALDEGLASDVFIKHDNGTLLTARVWPGDCYMPDFTHPQAFTWWKNQIENFNRSAPFDGLWIDMNEPASFVTGAVGGCPNTSLDSPWYVPKVIDNSLMAKTLCPSSKQHLSTQYNLHNLYGMIEAKVSMEVLQALYPSKRHFILTRSHFSGAGRWAAHWSGDNSATWDDLYFSIPETINFNMFGIPFYGPDICGFFDNTTEELCLRWMQLGAFLPFMRNHNGIGYIPQDPAIWSDPARQVMKNALILRYRLLPFWYTLNFQASINNNTIIQPLFYLYPKDPVARWLDTQFLLGRCIVVAPVLNKGVETLSVYLPSEESAWYTFPDLDLVTPNNGYYEMKVSTATLGLFIRPRCVIPMMTVNPDFNLKQNVRIANFTLLVTLDPFNRSFEGVLYWDDGISLPGTTDTIVSFHVKGKQISIINQKNSYSKPMILQEITVAGIPVDEPIATVTMNDVPIPAELRDGKLFIRELGVDINRPGPINIQWKDVSQHRDEL